jgi:predicted transcriptional regulator
MQQIRFWSNFDPRWRIDAMQTNSAKQEAIATIERLPDNVPLEEIIYRLHVLSKIHQGLGDLDHGRVVPSEELAAEIEQW